MSSADSQGPADLATPGTARGPIPEDASLGFAVDTLTTALTRKEHPSDFSDHSLATLFDLQAEYVGDVGLAAIREAQRRGTDVVSAVDVEHGDRVVRSGGRGKAWIEALGGVFAGAGTGTFLQIALEEHPSTVGLSVAALVAAVGLVATTAALFGRR